jgi:hypothetical protein
MLTFVCIFELPDDTLSTFLLHTLHFYTSKKLDGMACHFLSV